jgi:hypothetical protein
VVLCVEVDVDVVEVVLVVDELVEVDGGAVTVIVWLEVVSESSPHAEMARHVPSARTAAAVFRRAGIGAARSTGSR